MAKPLKTAVQAGRTPTVLRSLAIILATSVLLSGAAWAEAEPQNGQAADQAALRNDDGKRYVDDIRVQGINVLTEDQVKDALAMSGAPWQPWRDREVFTRDKLDRDVANVEKLLESQGFFHGEVEAEVMEEEDGDEVDLVFHVTEGDPVIITEILCQGEEVCTPELQKDVRESITLEKGDRFVSPAYRDSKNAILRNLRNQGHARARVDGAVLIDRDKNTAEVTYELSPGDIYHFGPVSVEGLEQTNRKVLLSRLEFSKGELFSQRKMDASQRALFALGAFATIELKVREPEKGQSENRLPVVITGTYRELREIKLGVGYGTEDKFRVQARWRHRHIAPHAQHFQVAAKYSSLLQSLEANIFFPYFFHRDQTFGDTTGVRREVETNYTTVSLFNNLDVSRRLTDTVSLDVGHVFELIRPEKTPEILPDGALEESENYRFSSFYVGATRDDRKPRLNPVKGTLLQTRLSYASDYFFSEIHYAKVQTEARGLLPLGHGVVLAGKILFSGIEPTEDMEVVPIFKRLFSGGGNSVRGYGRQELGPRDSTGDPAGGLSLYEASVEVRYPIWGDLGGVVFSDAGHVHPDSFSFDSGEVRFTAGLGLRYGTPVGPARLDWGYQLNPQEEGGTNWAVHASIGQAF
ncbi:MAG: autotransporter assembly complex protein TamA [Desulfatibacillaceae bacterium]